MEELDNFIKSNPDPRELKRAVVINMAIQCYTHAQIIEVMKVSLEFISKWHKKYQETGVLGLKLGYLGSKPNFKPIRKTIGIRLAEN